MPLRCGQRPPGLRLPLGAACLSAAGRPRRLRLLLPRPRSQLPPHRRRPLHPPRVARAEVPRRLLLRGAAPLRNLPGPPRGGRGFRPRLPRRLPRLLVPAPERRLAHQQLAGAADGLAAHRRHVADGARSVCPLLRPASAGSIAAGAARRRAVRTAAAGRGGGARLLPLLGRHGDALRRKLAARRRAVAAAERVRFRVSRAAVPLWRRGRGSVLDVRRGGGAAGRLLVDDVRGGGDQLVGWLLGVEEGGGGAAAVSAARGGRRRPLRPLRH
mmetsp:Transcript_32920/g.107483  ORF Transcript_32920/g.107483 Transcript_32920/m.107483 type:complete len:271 (+) Transcript_32920:95-907(+)